MIDPSAKSHGVAWRLFATCWIVFILHFATNTVREIYPALSLADHGSFDVSEYADFHPDIFRLDGGGAFINNNPGASLVGAVPYLLCKPLVDRLVDRVRQQRAANPVSQSVEYDSPWPLAREFMRKARERGLDVKFGLAAGIMQSLAMAPLSALAVVLMFRVLESLTASPRVALMLALLYAVATPILYRTAQLNQNVLIAHAAFAAFVLLWQPGLSAQTSRLAAHRFFLAGLLCGLCVLLDYSGLVVVLVLGIYALIVAREPRNFYKFGSGVAVGGLLLMAYQWSSFGHPLYPAQHYMPPAHFSEQGYQGFDWPRLDLLFDTTFGPRFGLFTSAPLLVLALWWPAWRREGGGLLASREVKMIVGLTAVFLLFCAANQYGRMQFNCGVRHVVPVTPFLFLLAAGTLLRMSRKVAVPLTIGCAYWSWCLAMYRDVERGSGIPESFLHITTGGPRLPWIETIWRMGAPLGAGVTAVMASTAVLLLTSILLYFLWRGCEFRCRSNPS